MRIRKIRGRWPAIYESEVERRGYQAAVGFASAAGVMQGRATYDILRGRMGRWGVGLWVHRYYTRIEYFVNSALHIMLYKYLFGFDCVFVQNYAIGAGRSGALCMSTWAFPSALR